MVWPNKKGLCIRLIRMGCVNRPFYQIGALPSTRRPHLLPDEVIGCIDPVPNEKNEIIASVDLKRLAYWMGRGAQLSNGTQRVLGLAGWIPIPPQIYIQALSQREKAQSPQTQTEDQIETVLPKKRIC